MKPNLLRWALLGLLSGVLLGGVVAGLILH